MPPRSPRGWARNVKGRVKSLHFLSQLLLLRVHPTCHALDVANGGRVDRAGRFCWVLEAARRSSRLRAWRARIIQNMPLSRLYAYGPEEDQGAGPSQPRDEHYTFARNRTRQATMLVEAGKKLHELMTEPQLYASAPEALDERRQPNTPRSRGPWPRREGLPAGLQIVGCPKGMELKLESMHAPDPCFVKSS